MHTDHKENELTNMEQDLNELIRVSLVKRDLQTGKLELHPLIRQFAMNKLQDFYDYHYIWGEKFDYYEDYIDNLETYDLVTLTDVHEIKELVEQCWEQENPETYFLFSNKIYHFLFNLGLWESAVDMIRLTIMHAQSTKNNLFEAYCRTNLGVIFSFQFKYQLSLNELEWAKATFLRCSNSEQIEGFPSIDNRIYWIDHHIVAQLYDMGNYAYLLESAFKNFRHYLTTDEHYNNAFSFVRIASWVYFHMGNFDKIESMNLSVLCHEGSRGYIQSFIRILQVQYERRLFTRAKSYIEPLKDIIIRSMQKDLLSSVLWREMMILIELNDFDSVEKIMEEWKSVTKPLGKNTFESDLKLIIGKISFCMGRFNDALDNFTKVKYEETKHYWLGRTYLAEGFLNKAKDCFEKSLILYNQSGCLLNAADTYIRLAETEVRKEVDADYFEAGRKFVLGLNTLKKAGITNLEEELSIQQAVIAKIGIKSYQVLEKDNGENIIELDTKITVDDLPLKIVSGDGKEMILVSEGVSFIGPGKEEWLFAEEVLERYPDPTELDNIRKDCAQIVYLYPYYIDIDPVTKSEYQQFCILTGHQFPQHWPDGEFDAALSNFPVTNINIEDAKAYANWSQKEIPIKEEWEKAYRNAQISEKDNNSGLMEMTASIMSEKMVVKNIHLADSTAHDNGKNKFDHEFWDINEISPLLGFRCVKPIFSKKDLQTAIP